MSIVECENDDDMTTLYYEWFRDDFWCSLKGLEYIKYLRWNKDKSYLRFRIYDINFQSCCFGIV